MCRFQYTVQRSGSPDTGLREEILLPWYTELANQYLATPYGSEWKGNFSLLHMYEKLAYDNLEDRFNVRAPAEPWVSLLHIFTQGLEVEPHVLVHAAATSYHSAGCTYQCRGAWCCHPASRHM